MEIQGFLKSKFFKVLLPMIILLLVFYIAKSGYQFGKWLYLAIN